MQFLGLTITRTKAAPPANLSTVSDRSWHRIVESFTGAWQRNVVVDFDSVVTYSAVYACVTLIASDIGKLRLRLVEQDEDDIWAEADAAAFSPVLRKPNRYQTRIKFIEQWVVSKLLHGNTYVLKERDNRGVVVRLYVLDPTRTQVLVAPDGSVFYRLKADNLSGIEFDVVVPASEIIHDTMVALYHPLCGVSPITACGLAATQGISIQKNSAKFFERGSNPGGILTAPAHIDDETAIRLKKHWEENYSGDNVGKVAVLGDGLTYEAMSVNAVDADLLNQLKWTAETVCSCFHVPPYMIGVGPPPNYNNIEALNQQYYSQCLQSLIESIELSLDEGLGLPEVEKHTYGTEFDLDDLLRMDSKTLAETEDRLKNIKTPNESRLRLNLPPVEGGDAVYRQQQDYSVEALAKRDAKEDPFGSDNPAPALAPGAVEFETLKSTFDAYGVGVRAGAITPQIDDEKKFREMANFPAPSTAVTDVWSSEPIRRPITLKSVGDDPALSDAATVDDDQDEPTDEKNVSEVHAAVVALTKRFDEFAAAPAPLNPEDEVPVEEAARIMGQIFRQELANVRQG